MKTYDIILVGAGASGVFASYEFTKLNTNAKILMVDSGFPIERRICPIKIGKTPTCIGCKPCAIMNGFGGAGTLSDGKYNITNNFGGNLHDYVGAEEAIELMEYVDDVLCDFDGGVAKLYSTASSDLKTIALRNDLHLLDAKVRHFGTERNVEILKKMSEYISNKVEMKWRVTVDIVEAKDGGFYLKTSDGE